jgi:hypothetical protein
MEPEVKQPDFAQPLLQAGASANETEAMPVMACLSASPRRRDIHIDFGAHGPKLFVHG